MKAMCVRRPARTSSGSVARRGRSCCVKVSAKVDLQGGPRIIRGKCYVTRDVRCQATVIVGVLGW